MMAGNMTNFTDFDSIVPLVHSDEEDDDEDPLFVGYIEYSMARMIPKFLRAMITLLICGLLLGLTFCFIHLWKRGCRKHQKLEEDEGKGSNGSAGAPLHSVVVTPPTDDDLEGSASDLPHTSLQPVRTKHMNVPKSMVRRASGPFSQEALSFVQEQYTMKNLEKEEYHPHHHHHPPHGSQHGHGHGHHHPVLSSGSSAVGGRSITPTPDPAERHPDSKPKFKFFKGTKE